MSKPTIEDANLMLKFYEIFPTDKELQDAMWWIFQLEETSWEDFKEKHPRGSEEYKKFMNIASFFEMIGCLVNNGLLHKHLVFDMFGSLRWNKAGPIAKGMRKEMGGSRTWENYEVLAEDYSEWASKNPPKV